MPKSKRARTVHTSKVAKKKGLKIAVWTTVLENAQQYSHIYVLSVRNMRNSYLKEVRERFRDSGKIVFGGVKLAAKALEEVNIPLSPYLKGDVGLLFTEETPGDVLGFFDTFVRTDYARAGHVATRTVTVPKGVVYSRGGEIDVEDDTPVPHSIEATLRKWGMPTKLSKGRVMLDQEYTIVEEGKVMDSNQTALLKMFGIVMADFKVGVVAYWNRDIKSVVQIKGAEDVMDES
ncbi:hypothetical protein K470DRAFT_259154 [Piedraia hortae CBS 480.64]|uniref:Ribosome assembly factor mrt4 n=1 Tax=Piedraia hortae CBS 480.64 TaxID=1314780 RepID=A0A6A7BV97_9PEZI|nr:hypothetical protein K470DRAFT_259154 [Piedraia hortae CBS 480.64]